MAGINVIADHVLVEPDWLRDCAALLAPLPAYLIGLRCPLEVLEQRERQRRDRTLGQARAQHAIVHAHGVYDLELDTSLHTPEECAAQVEAFLRQGRPPQALRALGGS